MKQAEFFFRSIPLLESQEMGMFYDEMTEGFQTFSPTETEGGKRRGTEGTTPLLEISPNRLQNVEGAN